MLPKTVMNFRDLGGLRAADGATTRHGLLFRSGDLGAIDEADARTLAGRFNLTRCCDLRSVEEVARDGAPDALAVAGVILDPHPVDTRDARFYALRRPMPGDWVQLYLAFFDAHRETYGRLLAGLATAQGPVVFGCAAGKDRTGIAAALVLLALGVEEGEILADYQATTAGLANHRHRFARYWTGTGRTEEEVVVHYLTASPEILLGFLAAHRAKPGGLAALLAAIGAGPTLQARLRERYLRQAA